MPTAMAADYGFGMMCKLHIRRVVLLVERRAGQPRLTNHRGERAFSNRAVARVVVNGRALALSIDNTFPLIVSNLSETMGA